MFATSLKYKNSSVTSLLTCPGVKPFPSSPNVVHTASTSAYVSPAGNVKYPVVTKFMYPSTVTSISSVITYSLSSAVVILNPSVVLAAVGCSLYVLWNISLNESKFCPVAYLGKFCFADSLIFTLSCMITLASQRINALTGSAGYKVLPVISSYPAISLFTSASVSVSTNSTSGNSLGIFLVVFVIFAIYFYLHFRF